jgi:hypothetical protein
MQFLEPSPDLVIATDGPGLDMRGVYAPFFWGFVLSIIMGGITIMQAYIYFPRYPQDRLFVKVIAWTMLIFDLTSSALVAQSLYYYLIPHFGSLVPLTSVTPELTADCLLSNIITFVSQMYFVYQIYAIRHVGKLAWVMIVVIAIGAHLAFAGGLGCVVTMIIHHEGVLAHRNAVFALFFGLAKGFGSFTDIAATISMCYFLKSANSGVSKQTTGLIRSLVHYIVNRGILVTLIQTLLLITFFSNDSELVWLAFHINVTKLYANTFFAMLNGRDYLKAKHATKASHGTGSSGITAGSGTFMSSFRVPTMIDPERTQVDDEKSLEMPTITKSVQIAEL